MISSIKEELEQIEPFCRNVIFTILNSKRLLSDHVEVLEDCLVRILPAKNSSLFTATKLLGLCLTSGVIFVHIRSANTRLSNLLPVLCTGYGGLCARKYYNRSRNCQTFGQVEGLLVALDAFERSIKKNIMFLNERAFLKASSRTEAADAKDKQVLTNCVQSIKDVIFAVYKDLKLLEDSYEVPSDYESFEDIENCEMLKSDLAELKLSNIKDFYNVFAYIQSQYLLCLGLVLCHNKCFDARPVCARFSNSLNGVLVEKTKDMTTFIEEKLTVDYKLVNNVASKSLPAPLCDLRKSSIQFSMKMTALLYEFQALDEQLYTTLQTSVIEEHMNKELLKLEANFETIANELPVLQDDYQRLYISFKKFLNSPVDQLQPLLGAPTVAPENPGKVYSGDTVDPQTDDFFAVDGFSDSDVSDKEPSEPHDLENFNAKVAKRYFQPVLKQLKQKIGPLGEAMKERERKVLHAKGIEVVDLTAQLSESNSDSDDIDDTGRMQRIMTKSDNRYGDVREYLANKEQVNIFMRLPVIPSMVTEDVLE